MKPLSERERRLGNSALALASLGATLFLWQTPVVLAVVLGLIGISGLALNRRRSLVGVYLGAFIGGPLAEAVMIYSGAWSYAEPHLLGFPLWLPFLWGNAAVLIASWRKAPND